MKIIITKENLITNSVKINNQGLTLNSFQIIRNNKNLFQKTLSHKFKVESLNVIIGQSGSGKSSLMEAILGLGENSNGKLFWGSHEIFSLLDIRQKVTYVPQSPSVLPTTIIDNITMGKALSEAKSIELKSLLVDLELTQLFDEKHRDQMKVISRKDLSGGELYRLALLRALFFKKSIICLVKRKGNLYHYNT